MDIFEIVGNHLFPTVHCLMVQPFRRMWENDDSPNKENCIKDFMYVELLCSPRKSNIFYKYDEDTRIIKVNKHVYGDENHQVSTDVMLAVMAYKEELTSTLSYELLNSSINLAHKMKNFLGELDPDEKTPHGALVLKPKEIFAALQEVPETIRKLEEARDKVNSDLNEVAKTRNSREVNPFER